MPTPHRDPYTVLGVGPDASDAQIRVVYRRLVQLHHPDHNGGSVESARRFEEVQEAYAEVRRLRASAPRGASAPGGASAPRATSTSQPPPKATDPDMEARLADLERQVREAHEARERARRAAREAAAKVEGRPSDEELGYVTTDDSFSKLLSDARDELADWLSDGGGHSAAERVGDLFDSLGEKIPRKKDP